MHGGGGDLRGHVVECKEVFAPGQASKTLVTIKMTVAIIETTRNQAHSWTALRYASATVVKTNKTISAVTKTQWFRVLYECAMPKPERAIGVQNLFRSIERMVVDGDKSDRPIS